MIWSESDRIVIVHLNGLFYADRYQAHHPLDSVASTGYHGRLRSSGHWANFDSYDFGFERFEDLIVALKKAECDR